MRAAILFAVIACGCGARTGLREPDASSVPDLGESTDRTGGDAGHCDAPTALLASRAEVVFVLDRSGSMNTALAGGLSRWRVLGGALGATLPASDTTLATGAVLFPVASSDSRDCRVGASLDVPVGLGHVPDVLAAVAAALPYGGTPTADALRVALDSLRARAGASVTQAIVLATDGGPNCNPADAMEPWYALAPEECPREGVDPAICLDDERTIAVIDDALAAGVPTYVIGMAVTVPFLVDTLDRMAVAGGRARPTSPRYEDVERPEDLRAALADIAAHVAGCRFLPSAPIDFGHVEVRIDGSLVRRDDSGADGWRPGPSGTVDFAGAACDAARRAGAVLEVAPPCP